MKNSIYQADNTMKTLNNSTSIFLLIRQLQYFILLFALCHLPCDTLIASLVVVIQNKVFDRNSSKDWNKEILLNKQFFICQIT